MSSITEILQGLTGAEMENVAHTLAEELRGERILRDEKMVLSEDSTMQREERVWNEAGSEKIVQSRFREQSETAPVSEKPAVTNREKAYLVLRKEVSDTSRETVAEITPITRGAETRHLQMRDISDFFRRDSRRYDGPFTLY